MQENVAWLGLDAHAKFSVLAWLDQEGNRRGHWRFPTTEPQLIKHLQHIPAATKHLALEECGLSRWLAQVARPHVTKAVVCDPRENHHISRHHHKCDEQDGYGLAHLHRLGALKAIWQPASDARAVFKCAAQAYLDAVDRQVALKLQLKAHYRQWGVMPVGSRVYGGSERGRWLSQIKTVGGCAQLQLLYEMLDAALVVESKTRRLLVQLGRAFPETGRLQTVPGIGVTSAHIFVAFLQEPTRFTTPQQLYRYCRLGVRDRSSDGKPLGYQQLDRHGHGVLKSLSYRAWLTAMRRGAGPVYEFYTQSLARTGSTVHARLNTQRKILLTLLTLWKRGGEFDGHRFLGDEPQPTAKVQCD
jgi:transposase